jgi:arylsulfatase A-like enzyme
VFAEHHHAWTTGGWFGIVDQRWKYIHYPGEAPSLFDRLNDPLELTDLGTDPDYERVRQACWAELQEVCDTEAVAERCRLDLGLPRVNDAVAG